MTPTRPSLTSQLPPSEFAAWYWLKEEMVAYCRQHKLPYAGTKSEIAAVIAAHL